MKKKLLIMIAGCVFAALLMTGCGESTSGTGNAGNPNSVDDVLQQQIEAAEGKNEAETETSKQSDISFYNPNEEEETPDIYSTEGVDMDLTQMSGTMLYSQVNYMMYKPEKFVGQTVKVPGTFSAVYSEEDGRYYFGCLVRDKAACCVLGVEFELPEDYVYPDDYPAEGEEITVFGTFDTYQQGEYTYAVLRDAKMVE
ncbi:MAG: hypothetical protein Q4A51_02445 [Lachnospiraceae bacterium]|nr:hypothetical protein [Lachnospiraceae bacterium]